MFLGDFLKIPEAVVNCSVMTVVKRLLDSKK